MPKKIGIVGAGLAGLAAGYALRQQPQTEITILEASDRVGGRVYSKLINGQMVDFGGFIIYPWYRQYHALIKELGLNNNLSAIPVQQVYYQMDNSGKYYNRGHISFPKKDTAQLALKMIKGILLADDLTHPPLHEFNDQTVADYFRTTLNQPKHAGIYETYADIITQGYCYPPATEYKLALLAPFIRLTLNGNDITRSAFMPQGNDQLPIALAKAITSAGHSILTNTTVQQCNDHALKTTTGTYQFDTIVFAQTVDHTLYQQIISNIPKSIHYTEYYTVAVELSDTVTIENDPHWDAVFFKPNQAPVQVTSAMNLGRLYGNALKRYVMLYIVIRQPITPLVSAMDLLAQLQPTLAQLWPGVSVASTPSLMHWSHTMPVMQETFIERVQAAQGKNDYYFAGDWLGSSSMETALLTGQQVAEKYQLTR